MYEAIIKSATNGTDTKTKLQNKLKTNRDAVTAWMKTVSMMAFVIPCYVGFRSLKSLIMCNFMRSQIGAWGSGFKDDGTKSTAGVKGLADLQAAAQEAEETVGRFGQAASSSADSRLPPPKLPNTIKDKKDKFNNETLQQMLTNALSKVSGAYNSCSLRYACVGLVLTMT